MGYFEEFIGVNLWTALFTLLNTLTVIYVGTKFLFKPIMDMIQARQQEIDDMYRQADEAKTRSASLEDAYKQKLATAQQTSDRMVKEAMARGQARQEEIIRQANAEASAMMDKAAADIAQEKKKAINEAKDEISGIAMAIAEKVVGRELNQADQSGLVDAFIDRLGESL